MTEMVSVLLLLHYVAWYYLRDVKYIITKVFCLTPNYKFMSKYAYSESTEDVKIAMRM